MRALVLAALLFGSPAAASEEGCQTLGAIVTEVNVKIKEFQQNAAEDTTNIEVGCRRMKDEYQPFLIKSIAALGKTFGTCERTPDPSIKGMIEHLTHLQKSGAEVLAACEKWKTL